MTTSRVTALDEAPVVGRARRRRAAWLVVPGVAMALVAAWLVLALTAGLVPSAYSWRGAGVVEQADGTAVLLATDPGSAGATALYRFRNPGRAPLEVEAGTTPPGLSVEVLAAGDDPSWGDADDPYPGTAVRSVHVGPGQEVLLRVTAGWTPCLPWGAGTGLSTEQVMLRVRSIGLARTVPVPLDPVLSLVTTVDLAPVGECS